MPEPWPVIDVSSWTDAGVEPDGRQRHNWLTDVSCERAWLFKPIRAGRESRPLGEHLVEKLASEIARHFGIPAARVELARRGATPGCIVEDVSLRKGSMFPGRALMLEVVDDYDSEDPEHQGHTVANIRRALEPLAAPPDTPTPEAFGAFDVFTGYLVFDALIANGDRHDGNWAVLRRPPGQHGADMLCASYDHASSLGFNLSDRERGRRLAERTVGSWAARGERDSSSIAAMAGTRR